MDKFLDKMGSFQIKLRKPIEYNEQYYKSQRIITHYLWIRYGILPFK